MDSTAIASTQESLVEEIAKGQSALIEYASTENFRMVVNELYSLPRKARDEFVETVLLDPKEQEERGLTPPNDIVIQRSAFGDGRPTLFCISKPLPPGMPFGWYKVTITFDNEPPI